MRAVKQVRVRAKPTNMEPPDGWRLLAAAFCSAAAAMQQLEPTAFLAAQQQHILRLERQIDRLQQQLKDQGARIDEVAAESGEPPPPHY